MMKKIKTNWMLLTLLAGVMLFATACSKDDVDNKDDDNQDWKTTMAPPTWLIGYWVLELEHLPLENVIQFHFTSDNVSIYDVDLLKGFTFKDAAKAGKAGIIESTGNDKVYEVKIMFTNDDGDKEIMDLKFTSVSTYTVDLLIDGQIKAKLTGVE